VQTKTCNYCKAPKPLTAFSRCSRERDGLQRKCRECAAELMIAYRAENAERIKALNAANNARRISATHTLAQVMHNMVRRAVKQNRQDA
jgi:hypothetical protein